MKTTFKVRTVKVKIMQKFDKYVVLKKVLCAKLNIFFSS